MKRLIIISGITGMLAVILGAFAAHALKPVLTIGQQATYETAVKYHFIHTLAVLICVLLFTQFQLRYFKIAAWLFLSGILLFSGSLYILSLKQLIGIESMGMLGIITPLGGTCFILGWIYLLLAGTKIRS